MHQVRAAVEFGIAQPVVLTPENHGQIPRGGQAGEFFGNPVKPSMRATVATLAPARPRDGRRPGERVVEIVV